MKEDHLKILLVDDEEIFLSSLETYLHSEIFCVVEKASSAQEAILLLNQEKNFDFIISDFTMPSGNGGDLLAHFSKTDMNAHFILHTSLVSPKLPTYDHRFLGVIDKMNLEEILVKIKEKINVRA